MLRINIERLVKASVVPSSSIVTLMKEALRSSETSVLKIVTLRNIPENAILHIHLSENLKSSTGSYGLHFSEIASKPQEKIIASDEFMVRSCRCSHGVYVSAFVLSS
jgi:hypothetical protein